MWLAAKASEWGRNNARLDVLWQIAQQFPKARWALDELAQDARAQGKTRDLYRVYSRIAASEPNNPIWENNITSLRLLLGIELDRAQQTASELFSQYPSEKIIASTYAYSLHLLGHTSEALNIMENLPEADLANPAIALYYGILLRADGQTQRAGKFLNLAKREALLPEERALLQEALRR
jgi:Flp pilus assembly protein TadD